jgi:hypothetical protein
MNRKSITLSTAFLAMALSAGCSSSQMSRIDRNRDLYESWPIEIRQAVLDGKVEPGMSPDMVRVSWGEPSEIVAQSGTGDEIWVYKRGGDDGSVIYPAGTGSTGMMGGTIGAPVGGVTVGTGRGMGTTIGTGMGTGVGIGGGSSVLGPTGGAPIITRPTPPDIREVVFRNGVVHRADKP